VLSWHQTAANMAAIHAEIGSAAAAVGHGRVTGE
jgi:hypothetical protein